MSRAFGFHRSNTALKPKGKKGSFLQFGQRFSLSSIFDSKISALSQSIQKNQGDHNKNKALFNEDTLELIAHILNKSNRTQSELLILEVYLKSLKNFVELLSSSSVDVDSMLMNISLHLKGEKVKNGNFVFKFGEKGNKYYLILKGSVSVLIPKENKVSLSLFDYTKFLIRLYIIRENELLAKTCLANKNIYPLNEREIKYFVKKYEMNDEEENEEKNEKSKCNVLSRMLSSKLSQSMFPEKNENENNEQIVISENSLISKFDEFDLKKLKDYIFNTQMEYKTFKFKLRKGLLNIDNYISLSYPGKLLNNRIQYSDTKVVNAFSYFEVVHLQSGDSFGEIALSSASSKRTATIMTSEDCIFGTLAREAYSLSIKGVKNKIRRGNIKFLINFKIFSMLNWNFFEKKIFNYFKKENVVQNQKIIEQGEKSDSIFFVMQGEFEICSKMNDEDLYYFAKKLRKKGKDLDTPTKITKNFIDDEKKKLRKISILKENDIIGLSDLLISKNISGFTVRCSSLKGSLFSIERNIFNYLCLKIKEVNNEVERLTQTKIKMLIQRIEVLLSVNPQNDLNKQKKNIHDREYTEMVKKMRALSAFGGLRRKDNEKKQKKIYLNTSKINETSPPQKQILSNRLPTSYQNYQSISDILINDYNSSFSPSAHPQVRNVKKINSKSYASASSKKKTLSFESIEGFQSTQTESNEQYLKQILGSKYRKNQNHNLERLLLSSKPKSNKVFVDVLQFDTFGLYSNKHSRHKCLKSYFENFSDKDKALSIRLNDL